MFYLIRQTLEKSSMEEALGGTIPYAAVLTPEEWEIHQDRFSMGIDLETEPEFEGTMAQVNYDSLTGCFSIPDREDICGKKHCFRFALDENGVIFIDERDCALKLLEELRRNCRWRFPGLERFLYDFLEQIVRRDLKMLETYETRLEELENRLLADDCGEVMESLNEIRGELLELSLHYEQLIDLGQELEENENHFFREENLRYFHLITARLERYRDKVQMLRDYCVQIRDLYQTRMDARQNRVMNILTVLTTIFFPLTLITGWYGMNFTYMPELAVPYAYPLLILICLGIIAAGLIISRKNKWL